MTVGPDSLAVFSFAPNLLLQRGAAVWAESEFRIDSSRTGVARGIPGEVQRLSLFSSTDRQRMREEKRTIATVEHGVFGLPSPDWNEEKLENLLHFDEVCVAAASETPPRRLPQNPSSGGFNSSDKEEEHLCADLVSAICYRGRSIAICFLCDLL